jgi:DNA repair protein RecN (Recombination protein N)
MIKSLRIRNLATIEDIELGFKNGFTILTGETGTGKSIIIGGLKLVLGDKGSPDIIRTGEQETSVEAVFQTDFPGISDKNRSKKDNGEIFIHRNITGQGQGKGYFDGILVPAKKLKDWGESLVNIYGQNDHVFLKNLEYQLDYFDVSAGVIPLRNEVTKLAQEIRRLQREKKSLEAKEKERALRQDFLEFQVNEIENSNLSPREEEELRQDRNILRNAEKIRYLVAEALDTTCDQEFALSSQLARLRNTVTKLIDFGSEFKDISEAISLFTLSLNEFTDFLIKFKEKHDASPADLEAIEDRLNTIEKLKRKYGSSIEEVLLSLEKARDELSELESNQDRLSDLNHSLEKIFQEYLDKAEELSKKRKEHSSRLEDRIKKEINILGMKKADFSVNLRSFSPDKKNMDCVKDKGIEDVEFLISPNPGEELRSLRKIASGGELSRIMLALKSIGSNQEKNKTLIFDEIDAGIGGKTAEFVARKLKDLSQNNQVICITHLPQIASFAHHHFKIEKKIARNRTFTTVKELNFEERIEEISRLLAGSRITPAARQNAREMLEHNS